MDHAMHDMSAMSGMAQPVTALTPLAAETALPRNAALPPVAGAENLGRQPGLFQAELTAAPLQVELLSGQATTFWAYNGSVPGPLIE